MSWAETGRNGDQTLYQKIPIKSLFENKNKKENTQNGVLQGQEKVLQGQED